MREATLKEFLPYLQNAGAIAFVLLGVATAVSCAKRRDRSLGFLALTIALLSLIGVSGPRSCSKPIRQRNSWPSLVLTAPAKSIVVRHRKKPSSSRHPRLGTGRLERRSSSLRPAPALAVTVH